MKTSTIITKNINTVRDMFAINFANDIRFFGIGDCHYTYEGNVADMYDAVKKTVFGYKTLAKVAVTFAEDGTIEVRVSKSGKVTFYNFYKDVETMENNIIPDVMFSIQVKH